LIQGLLNSLIGDTMTDCPNMLTTIVTSAITALITGLIAFTVQERKLKTELRTEFMAEKVAKSLLESENYKKRSFDEIKKRLGGFKEDELQKILVRAGAVRFNASDGKELWGLISRNKEDL
jgi:hypothetical protein